MSDISLRKQELLKKFKGLEDWEDKYKLILHYGKKLDALDPTLKLDHFLVKGCMSKVWLIPKFSEDEGKLYFLADSDAAIVKGIIGVLVYLYSGLEPNDIMENPADFLKEVGIEQHISMNRRNGLANMSKLLFEYAQKFAQNS